MKKSIFINVSKKTRDFLKWVSEIIKFEADAVLKIKEFTKVNDCFQYKSNEEIDVFWRSLITALSVTFMLLLSTHANAQKFDGLDKSPLDIASYPSIHDDSNTIVRVIYSRPQLKGRSLSKLIPNGKIWRTGANEATEITFYKDVKFGGKAVKEGTYSLATIPGDKEWTIILNTDLNTWGAYSYNETNDIARVKVPVSKGKKSLEAFSIAFQKTDKGANMFLAWDTLRVVVPIEK